MGTDRGVGVIGAVPVIHLLLLSLVGNAGTAPVLAAPQVRFVDVAESAGLVHPNVWGGVDRKDYIIEAKGSGLGFIDFDADGWLDIYITNGVRLNEAYSDADAPVSHLYRNRRDGTFEDVARQAGVARTGWQTGVCVADFDNDGWDDLMTTEWGHNVLYRNLGDGRFEDVTERAGLHDTRVRWGSGCTWLDFDRDGWVDLFVSNYVDLDLAVTPRPGEDPACVWKGMPVMCGPRGLPPGSDLLYRNRGDGTFEDVSRSSGILSAGPAYSITSVSADFDGDGWPDIFVAVDSRPSLFFVNRRDGTFEETGMIAGCAYSESGTEQAGMGVGVGDFNGDGWLDIFKTNFQYDNCNLYQNLGDGTFRDVSVLAGLGGASQYVNWGAGFTDFDNDGWTDILYVTGHVYPGAQASELQIPMATPRIALWNRGNGRFEDVSSQLGPGITQRFASRGCAFGDYDNDGDEDVVVLNMNDRPSLLRNDNRTGHHWVILKLVGTRSNRSAVGARVTVIAGGRQQVREVMSGGSVMSMNDLRLHFGLGTISRIDGGVVRWPSGQEQKLEGFDADRIVMVREPD
jgi:hypothetical protein